MDELIRSILLLWFDKNFVKLLIFNVNCRANNLRLISVHNLHIIKTITYDKISLFTFSHQSKNNVQQVSNDVAVYQNPDPYLSWYESSV